MDLASKEFLRLYSLLLENRDLFWEKQILERNYVSSAYSYAKDVIKGRWPEAEEFIKNSPWAYEYARDVIKGRWPEAEEAIKKRPEDAFLYALEVVKGRWPEAEEYIKRAPSCAFNYAVVVLRRRWPEAEEFIMKDSNYWNLYLLLICQYCQGEGIIGASIGGAEEECPRCNGGGLVDSLNKFM